MAWLITEDLLIDHLRDDTDGTEVLRVITLD